MTFELIPVLDKMAEFYEKPANFNRFKDYLKLLTGNTDNDLELPIGAFNPMAKEHVLQKLNELRDLKAEKIASETFKVLNQELKNVSHTKKFKVVLCLSDDLKGGWTNRYTCDYDSKFKLNALIARNFCTPIFWTSENFDAELIKQRIREYCYRTLYWLDKPKPTTLLDHVLQEQFVADKAGPNKSASIDHKFLSKFFDEYKSSEEYPILFNFFYGDNASVSLGNKAYGVKDEFAGFKFAAIKPFLISEITKAFKDVILDSGIGLTEATAIDDYRDKEFINECKKKDEKLSWNSIPSSALNENYTALSFFDDKGMRFHLPAFMICEIKEEYNFGMSFVLTHLSDYSRSQFKLLSKTQRAAVKLFLEYLLEHPGYEFENPEIKAAIENYWSD